MYDNESDLCVNFQVADVIDDVTRRQNMSKCMNFWMAITPLIFKLERRVKVWNMEQFQGN